MEDKGASNSNSEGPDNNEGGITAPPIEAPVDPDKPLETNDQESEQHEAAHNDQLFLDPKEAYKDRPDDEPVVPNRINTTSRNKESEPESDPVEPSEENVSTLAPQDSVAANTRGASRNYGYRFASDMN